MRIIFCDDDYIFLENIQTHVKAFFQSNSYPTPQYAVYHSGDELLQKGDLQADIAFLDVEMSGVGGIQIGQILKKHNPYIKIFIITAYSEYLDDAMRFQVFRYLTKPVDQSRLYRNLQDAVTQYLTDTKVYSLDTASGILLRRAEEIICVESKNKRTLIYTTKEVVEAKEPLKVWRERLTLPHFCATHRSYLINLRFVNSMLKDTVILQNGDFQKEVYLTRRKFHEVKDAFLFYLEGAR